MTKVVCRRRQDPSFPPEDLARLVNPLPTSHTPRQESQTAAAGSSTPTAAVRPNEALGQAARDVS